MGLIAEDGQGQDRGTIDGTGQDLITGIQADGPGFTGQGRIVNRTPLSLQSAIQGNPLARVNQDFLAHLDPVRCQVKDAFRAGQVGDQRPDGLEGVDGPSGPVNCPVFQGLAQKIKEHDGHCFGIFADDKSPYGGHGHEEVFRKEFAPEHIDKGLDNDTGSYHQVGCHKDQELDRAIIQKQGQDKEGQARQEADRAR